ncbi:MAG: hypothetical protein ABIJ11_02495 [Elusimicrobiota bacterium]
MNSNKRVRLPHLIFLVCAVFLLTSDVLCPAEAKLISPNYQIPTEVLSSGGGSGETENFIYDDTIGQPAVEVSASQNYTALLGYYWGYYIDFPVSVNFDPDTLNLRSEGRFVTVYIEMPPGYSPTEIDIRTVHICAINGTDVSPIQCLLFPTGITDEDSDGQKELMVKFDREAIGSVLTPAENVKISFAGDFITGDTFVGNDTIRVINPPEDSPSYVTTPAKGNTHRSNAVKTVNIPSHLKVDEIAHTELTSENKGRTSVKSSENKNQMSESKLSRVLFPEKLKFNNGTAKNIWSDSDSGILSMKDKYPDWKERQKRYEHNWTKRDIEKPVISIPGADQNTSSLIYTYTVITDGETGEIVWHSNFGAHSGQFKDMRAEYRNDIGFQKHIKDTGNWDNRLTVRNSKLAEEHKMTKPPIDDRTKGNDDKSGDMPENISDNKGNSDEQVSNPSKGRQDEKGNPDNSDNTNPGQPGNPRTKK